MKVIAVGVRIGGVWKVRTSLWRYLAATACGGGSLVNKVKANRPAPTTVSPITRF